MLSLQQLSSKYTTSISTVVAIISLAVTLIPFRKSPQSVQQTSVRVFNIASNQGLDHATFLPLDKDPHTNRTIWQTVATSHVQAGLERLEPGAWIPPHSHHTEEILLVYSGIGEAYDENGHVMPLSPGSMVHIRRGGRHAFRNTGIHPMWLMWSFPRSSNKRTFEFHQKYGNV